MTLHTFIETIKTAGDIPGSLENIAIELYHYLGIFYAPDSIKAALSNSEKKKRSPLPKDQDSINESGFFKYFKERTSTTWKEMQAAFGKLDEDGLIDQNTRDRNVFYESLLALFYDILRLVPISLLDILPQMPLVFGREVELKHLADIFETRNYAILTGVGGIGKSCVALSYAHTLKKTGNWTVQHIICENDDTLQTAIIKLRFNGLKDTPKAKKNAKKENLERRITCLKNSRKHMLIVLDNLNQLFTAEDSDTFKRLIGCGNHVHILITSRNTLTDDKQCMVHLAPLNEDALLELYAYHRFESNDGHKDYIAQHEDILMKLFSIVEKHTLMIELLAKLSSRIFIDEYEIHYILSCGLSFPLKGISVKKDGKPTEVPPEGLVKILFDSSNLTDSEKSVMRHMSIIPASGISIKLFENLTRCSQEDVHKLRKCHWIIIDEENFTMRLHPLICETILSFDDVKPTKENCAKFIDAVKKKRDIFETGSLQWHTFNKILFCYAENVLFRDIISMEISYEDEAKNEIGPIKIFPHLNRKCINDVLSLNKIGILDYLNSESLEGWIPLSTLSDRDDDNS